MTLLTKHVLTKHHGLGNDFLILLDERNGGDAEATPARARAWCDRHLGIGADGLLHGTARSADGGIDTTMTLYNADGSRAEMSGNGIRCLVQALADARGLGAGDEVRIATDGGVRICAVGDADEPGQRWVRVDMGAAKPGPSVDASLAAELPRHVTVDLGNPHLVVVVDDDPPVGDELARRGAHAESFFPDGINVEFVRVLAPDRLELTVWERGAGITAACGTGASASGWAANRWGLADPQVSVAMPGGSAAVEVRADDGLTLTGPSVHIATIEVP